MSVFIQIIVNGVLAAAIYALVAGGVSFLYSTTKIFHLAHGVVVAGGGYAFWWAWTVMQWHPAFSVLFAILIAALAGLLMNELVYEPLRAKGTKGIGYLIATLALLILGIALISLIFGAAPKTFNFETPSLVFGDVYITVFQVWMIIIAVLLLGLFFWITHWTKFGKAMRATADNEVVAEVLGVNTRQIRRLVFGLTSLLAAAAGIIQGLEFNLDPNIGIMLAVQGFTAAVIGGVGSFGGALWGSLMVGLLEQSVVWFWGQGWRSASTFIVLFLILLFRPSGLFGKRSDL